MLTTLAGSGDPRTRLARAPATPFHKYQPIARSKRPVRDRWKHAAYQGGGESEDAGTNPTHDPDRSSHPRCDRGTTRYNVLKIRPYTATLIRSAARPVVVPFGTSVDANVTGYAWRAGRKYGTVERRATAGQRTLTLRGGLDAGSYYAVLVARSGPNIGCDARRLKIMRAP